MQFLEKSELNNTMKKKIRFIAVVLVNILIEDELITNFKQKLEMLLICWRRNVSNIPEC